MNAQTLFDDPSVLELMPTGVYIIDDEGLIRGFNEKACGFWGQTPKIRDHANRFCGAYTPMAAAVQEGTVCNNMEATLLRTDGTEITVVINISPLRDDTGKIVGAINAFQDITEVKEVRQRIETHRVELEKRDSFLSICSHELKTPLTALILRTQIAKRKLEAGDTTVFEPAKISQMIDQNSRLLSRVDRLVDDMLDLHRIKSGNLTLVLENVELVNLVKEVVLNNAAGIGDLDGRVSVHAVNTIEGRFDRKRIEQVVTNLITNAVKYSSGGPIAIDLSEVQETAKIKIHDSGIGIDEKDHQRIFERFTRAESESPVVGLGIGLYVTREIVEAHRGQINVQSALGQGSTFTVDLPLNRVFA